MSAKFSKICWSTAHNDARRKAELAVQEKMQALTGGLGLPPGLGFS